MPDSTKSVLVSENSDLKARVAELEGLAPLDPAEEGSPPESDPRRERAENALQASELRYRRLFEAAKDGILILDADTGRVTDVNKFLENLLGYSHDELLGVTLWEIGSFRDVAANKEAYKLLQAREYIRYDDLPLETRSGQQIPVEFVSNVYLANGKRVIQCNIRDVSERHHAKEALQKAHDDLLALVEELRKSDGRMQTLNRVSDLLQSCTTQEEAYKVIGVMGNDLFPDQTGSIAILHSFDQRLETVATWGTATAGETTFSLEDCWALRRGQPHQARDPETSLLCRHFITPPVGGSVCVPLTVQGETLGLLCILGVTTDRNGSLQVALTAGEAIKLCLSNLKLRERLREQATHDPLTGLFNRRYLEESLEREVHRARRSNSPLCIAMIDLDHFKRLNDTSGHGAGDAVLREVGQVLRDRLRRSDISCRYGGEEFVVVLPDSSLEVTVQRLEEIRLAVRALQIRHGDQLLAPTTLSAGVAKAPEREGTGRDLLRAADDALYNAKQSGRDRISVYKARI